MTRQRREGEVKIRDQRLGECVEPLGPAEAHDCDVIVDLPAVQVVGDRKAGGQ